MRKRATIIFIFLIPVLLQAQFPAFFGQYMFTGLAINPGYAGSTGMMNATIIYRNQWAGFAGAPETQMLSWHAPLKDKKNNVGMIMGHDRYGVSRQFLLSGVYAYRIDAGRIKISMGLQGGLSTLQNRWDDLDLPDPTDQAFPLNTPAVLVPQFGTGLYIHHNSFYAGASIPELMKFKGSQYQLFFSNKADFRLFFVTGGCILKPSSQFAIKPSILLKYSRNSKFQADLNLNFLFKDVLWIGGSFRTSDAVIGIIELQTTDQVRIGYAYERSISPLRYFNSGTHELVLSFDFKFRLRTAGPRYF